MEGVDVVRAAFDAFQRGDEPAMFALVSEDVVVRQFPDQLDVRDYRGHAGLREMMATWIGTWDDWSIELERLGCGGPRARERIPARAWEWQRRPDAGRGHVRLRGS